MTKTRLLSTVAAATLLFAAGAASAQNMKKDEAPAPAPAVQQKAPAEKMAPALKPGDQKAGTQKAPEKIGQAPKASDGDKTRATDKGAMDKGATDKSMDKDPAKSAADKPMDKGPAAKSAADAKNPSDANGVKGKANERTTQAPAATSPKSSQSITTEKGATSGQNTASGPAKLSVEQRTKISTIIKQQKTEPARVNFSVSVGARVPSTVRYYPLPVEVFVIYPEWRGYDYVQVGDEILVIDPRTHQIVAIIEA